MIEITSLQNTKVKLTHALQTQAKSRRKEGKIVLEGVRLVRDAVDRGYLADFVLYTSGADEALIAELQRHNEVLAVTDEVMRHVSDTQQPQGIIGVFAMPRPSLPDNPRRILILDAIRDPGNLGTILRTAAAADVQAVILSSGSVDPYNPKALRGGMGAHFRVPVVEAGWNEIATYCAKLNVYLAAGDGDVSYAAADWSSAWALIIGSEAHGAGMKSVEIAQQRISIPLAADTESLNAAAATAVLLFEAQRQRTQP